MAEVNQVESEKGIHGWAPWEAPPRDFNPSDPERMDEEDADASELEGALLALERLNRNFGVFGLLKRFLKHRLSPGENYTMLDIAAGGGDIAREAVDFAKGLGAQLEVQALDKSLITTGFARKWSERYPEIEVIHADALAWELSEKFADRPPDFVTCFLALHHFSDQDAVKLLRRLKSWAGKSGSVLVCDLCRSYFGIAAIHAMTALLERHPMVVDDGRKSIRRAFTKQEMSVLAREAGWEHFSQVRLFPARQAIWLA